MHTLILHTSHYACYEPSCIYRRLMMSSPIAYALVITRPDGRLLPATLRHFVGPATIFSSHHSPVPANALATPQRATYICIRRLERPTDSRALFPGMYSPTRLPSASLHGSFTHNINRMAMISNVSNCSNSGAPDIPWYHHRSPPLAFPPTLFYTNGPASLHNSRESRQKLRKALVCGRWRLSLRPPSPAVPPYTIYNTCCNSTQYIAVDGYTAVDDPGRVCVQFFALKPTVAI
ncbi:hypothetical protein P691DRAFT_779337 [Macrolepiota fuliginosa MF-IS2]|uniref:Uncharacterized protein n=1 Tax=Macrolepiota fuliginosa MF-IS2 TaxID=1400762 RepID=A0A9P5X3J0_9AGAR|nr:hypothetical protein P691DRAFT_779337 [Macrolepiota fuliginosa MF-IS2]